MSEPPLCHATATSPKPSLVCYFCNSLLMRFYSHVTASPWRTISGTIHPDSPRAGEKPGVTWVCCNAQLQEAPPVWVPM